MVIICFTGVAVVGIAFGLLGGALEASTVGSRLGTLARISCRPCTFDVAWLTKWRPSRLYGWFIVVPSSSARRSVSAR